METAKDEEMARIEERQKKEDELLELQSQTRKEYQGLQKLEYEL